MSLLVISGPSGSGKSTLIKMLQEIYPGKFSLCVSHTTRKCRNGEKDGVDYFFIDEKKFKKKVNKDEFLEFTTFGSKSYGTSIKAYQSVINSGKICVLDIESHGVKQLKDKHINGTFVFVRPSSIETLKDRLKSRGSETPESLEKRMQRAKLDFTFGDESGYFDHVVINDNKDDAIKELVNIATNKFNLNRI